MPGPMPKRAAVRQRTNRSTTHRLLEAPVALRPDIPSTYHDLTKAWWSTIWGSPIAEEWVDADVPGLVALAQLIEDFWRAEAPQRAKAHAEVRMASREYGLSPFSRRQLQWEIKKVEAGRVQPPEQHGTAKSSRAVLSVLGGKGT